MYKKSSQSAQGFRVGMSYQALRSVHRLNLAAEIQRLESLCRISLIKLDARLMTIYRPLQTLLTDDN